MSRIFYDRCKIFRVTAEKSSHPSGQSFHHRLQRSIGVLADRNGKYGTYPMFFQEVIPFLIAKIAGRLFQIQGTLSRHLRFLTCTLEKAFCANVAVI